MLVILYFSSSVVTTVFLLLVLMTSPSLFLFTLSLVYSSYFSYSKQTNLQLMFLTIILSYYLSNEISKTLSVIPSIVLFEILLVYPSESQLETQNISEIPSLAPSEFLNVEYFIEISLYRG